MTFSTQLRIPGPTPLPDRVVRAMSRPMIDHRGPEFAAILAGITSGARRVFKTSGDLVLLTSSGTGGLESAVANLVSPGDEVVVALSGNFGERFAALAAGYGADVVRLEFEWGQPVDADDLARVLEHHPKAKVLFMQRLGLGEAEAFQYLRRRSLEAGRPLGDTAARLLAAEQQWFGQADLAGCMHLLLDVLVRGRPSWPWSRTSPRFSRIPSST